MRRAFAQGEFAIACSVKFDALPSKGAVTGLIDVTADKDGVVKVRVPKAKTSLDRDFVCYSRAKVKAGEWHHLAFNFSRIRDRAAFYLDGSLQYENDDRAIPVPLGGETIAAPGFKGEVKDLKVWDIALESDRIIPAADGKGSRWDAKHAARIAARTMRFAFIPPFRPARSPVRRSRFRHARATSGASSCRSSRPSPREGRWHPASIPRHRTRRSPRRFRPT